MKTNDAVEAAKAEVVNVKWRARLEFHERRQLETNEHDFAFLDGFDAGLRHAGEWVAINGPDDLPTKGGRYLWTERDLGRAREHSFYAHNADCRNYFARHYIAWQEMPAPYNPKEDENVGEI